MSGRVVSPPGKTWIEITADFFDDIHPLEIDEAAQLAFLRLLQLCGQQQIYDTIGASQLAALQVPGIEHEMDTLCRVGLVERIGDSYRIPKWNKPPPGRPGCQGRYG